MAKKKSHWEKPASSEAQAKIASVLDEVASENNGSPVHTFESEPAVVENESHEKPAHAQARESHDQHPKFDKFKKGKE